MAPRAPKTAPNRRASKEAIAKRRAGRAFNDALAGGANALLDGRTRKRKQRILDELKSGKTKRGRELKPLEVLIHVNEAMDLGETVAKLRRICRPTKPPENSSHMADVIAELHSAYDFRAESYQFVGIDDELLVRAGVIPDGSAKPKKRRRSAE